MSPKKKLLINTLVFSALLEIIAVIMTFTLPETVVSKSLPFLVPFFLSISILTNLPLISVPAENPNKFVRVFMLTTFSKFILYAIVLFIYSMINKDDAVKFMLSFMVLFILYLVFDVVFLINNLPKKR